MSSSYKKPQDKTGFNQGLTIIENKLNKISTILSDKEGLNGILGSNPDMTTQNNGEATITSNQGLTVVEKKLNNISTILPDKEGFNGILGSNPEMNARNNGEATITNNQVNSLNNNLAQYTTAETNLKNKTNEYLDKESKTSLKRNYNVFVNQYSNAQASSMERCVNVSNLSSNLSNGLDFTAAYTTGTGATGTTNLTNFIQVREACKTWAIDSGKNVFAITKDAQNTNFTCKVGTDNQLGTAAYTSPTLVYPLNGAGSGTATKGGLFLNGLIGVYKPENIVENTKYQINSMPAPFKIDKYYGVNVQFWNIPARSPASFPEKQAYWVSSSSNYYTLGKSKYIYYGYNNTSGVVIPATVDGIADDYIEVNMIYNFNGVPTRKLIMKSENIMPTINVVLQLGPNIFEFRYWNKSGPGGMIIAVRANLGTGMATLFKTGDEGWGISASRPSAADLIESNSAAAAGTDSKQIKYFVGYNSTTEALEPYAKCDPINGGNIYRPSVTASFGRNCSNITTKPIMGRYIKVRYPAGLRENITHWTSGDITNPYIQISQIVVMGYQNGQLVNLASNGLPGNTVGGSVKAKSVYDRFGSGKGLAKFAIDGNQSAKSWPNIYLANSENPDEYWLLDLGSSFAITQIIYFNRGDGLEQRANGMTIELWNSTPSNSGNPVQVLTLNGSLKQIFNIKLGGSEVDCSMYSEDDKYVSKACMDKVWTELGCTTKLDPGIYPQWTPLPQREWKKNMVTAATDPVEEMRDFCYGPDIKNWPPTDCSVYNDQSTNVPNQCVAQEWIQAGCTTPLDNSLYKQFRPNSKGTWMKTIQKAATDQSDEYRGWCYGPDPTKWPPADCSIYNNDSTNLPSSCIDEVWASVGCTTKLDPGIYPVWRPGTQGSWRAHIQKAFTSLDFKDREFCYGPDRSTWCDLYTDNDKWAPNECIDKAWAEAGCTTKLGPAIYPAWRPYSQGSWKQEIQKASTDQSDESRGWCYGPDKTKWPETDCSIYDNKATKVPSVCIDEAWVEAGCTTKLSAGIYPQWRPGEKGAWMKNIQTASKSLDFKDREFCYGTNKYAWCDLYTDNDKWAPNECIDKAWTEAGCTTKLSAGVYSQWRPGTQGNWKREIQKAATDQDEKMRKFCYGPDRTMWPDPDCSVYSDTDKNVPTACIDQAWAEAGCTTKLDAGTYSQWKPATQGAWKFQINRAATSNADDMRKYCYGEDPTKWPPTDCSSYGDNDRNVPVVCMDEAWAEAGCTTKLDAGTYAQWTPAAQGAWKIQINRAATSNADDMRKYCYGEDPTKWPDIECSSYTNNDKNVPKVCMDQAWAAAGCTTTLSDASYRQWKPAAQGAWKKQIKKVASSKTDVNRKWCYGS